MNRAAKKRLAKYGNVNGLTTTPTVGDYVHKCSLSFVKTLDSEDFDKNYVLRIIAKVEENADCMLHNYINQRDVETMCRELGCEFMDYINKNYVFVKPDGAAVYYVIGEKRKTVTQFIRLYALSFALALDSEGVEKTLVFNIMAKAAEYLQSLMNGETEDEIESMCLDKYGIDFADYVAKHPVFVNPDGTLVTG